MSCVSLQARSWAAAVALAVSAPLATAAVTDQQVTPAYIVDFEFDQAQNRFVFSDRERKMWIGRVDPATGAFVPPDGKGLLIDTDVAFTTDFGNGPEWVYAAAGKQLVYTRYLPGLPRTPENARVAAAVVENDAWVARLLDDRAFNFPIGSLNPQDAAPSLTYVSTQQPSPGFYWRELARPETEELVPNSAGSVWSRRFVEGTRAIVFSSESVDPQGQPMSQAFRYDTQTKVLEQLTFDAGPKSQVFMWRAPEFGGNFVFFTLVNRNELRFYRKIDVNGDGNPVWTAFNSVFAPSWSANIWSPEPFVHGGKSYVTLVVSPSTAIFDLRVPTNVAMVSPRDSALKILTDPRGPKRVRSDPEVYVTQNGPYIYYNSYIPQTGTSPGTQNGVWRIDPGLGPP